MVSVSSLRCCWSYASPPLPRLGYTAEPIVDMLLASKFLTPTKTELSPPSSPPKPATPLEAEGYRAVPHVGPMKLDVDANELNPYETNWPVRSGTRRPVVARGQSHAHNRIVFVRDSSQPQMRIGERCWAFPLKTRRSGVAPCSSGATKLGLTVSRGSECRTCTWWFVKAAQSRSRRRSLDQQRCSSHESTTSFGS